MITQCTTTNAKHLRFTAVFNMGKRRCGHFSVEDQEATWSQQPGGEGQKNANFVNAYILP